MSKYKLCEIGFFKNGLNFSADKVDSGCKIIGIPDFGDKYVANIDGLKEINSEIVTSDYYLKENDILLVRSNGNKNLVGRSMIIGEINEPVSFSGFCIRFRVTNNQVLPLYVLYLLKSPLFRKLFSNTQQTSISNLNQDILGNIEFDIPSLNEQHKIVEILHSITLKIETNEKINDNLVQQITLLYNYWFTQYDFPNDAGQPYKSSGGPMIYNDVLGRKIPATWNVKKLLDVVTWESNSQPPKSEFIYTPREGYIRFIQNRDYDSGEYKTYIPLSSNLSIATKFDILMDKYGDAGAVRYGIEGAFNVALGKIRVNELKYQEYIRSYLESKWVYSYLHNSCMASTRASLNETNLSMLSVVIPEDKVLLKFQKIAHDIRTSILKTKDENEKLIHLRNWLLPMLMNGQATITD